MEAVEVDTVSLQTDCSVFIVCMKQLKIVSICLYSLLILDLPHLPDSDITMQGRAHNELCLNDWLDAVFCLFIVHSLASPENRPPFQIAPESM